MSGAPIRIDFIWRISMARVEQPGPFSAFPGVDRVLAVLEGESLVYPMSQQHVSAHDSNDCAL